LASSIRKGVVAPLRLAVDSTVAMKPVVDILTNLRQSIDGIELTLGSGSRRLVIADALEGDFDLVVASQAGETPDRMRSWLLFHEQCHVIVPKEHRFAKQDAVTLADLDNEPMVERIDCCLSPGFQEACQTAGVRPEFRHRATSEDQLQRMVLAGFGVGVSPPTIPLLDGLVGVKLDGNALEREVVLATVPGRRFSAAADAFVKVARSRDWSKSIVAA